MVPLLRPLGRLYGSVAQRRFRSVESYRCSLPVICVGNFTAGGTGKTPLAIRIVEELTALGQHPAVLTRGYGGRRFAPHWVEGHADTASEVGDEALLLAQHAPTLVATDRRAGALAIERAAANCSVIVMDDGMQNPTLAKDLTLAVVDGSRGVGNGEVIPAGPLRAPLDFQLGLVDAIVINTPPPGDPASGPEFAARLRQEFPGPVLTAHARAKDAAWIKGARLVAYAGIGNPHRFFLMLAELGGELLETIAFPDHHSFSEADAERLLRLSATHAATLITTEKDLVRLRGSSGKRAELLGNSRPLSIEPSFNEREATRFSALLTAALKGNGY